MSGTKKVLISPLLIVLLVGAFVALLITGTIRAWQLSKAMTSGDPKLDRLRWPLAKALVASFGTGATPQLAQAMMCILHNESAGAQPPIIGDQLASGGPSVGPFQVYRRTAIDLGLWTEDPSLSDADKRDAYAQNANDEDLCTQWAVKVFKSKLQAAGGDVADAIRRYNGGGTAADNYKAKALAYAQATYGGLFA